MTARLRSLALVLLASPAAAQLRLAPVEPARPPSPSVRSAAPAVSVLPPSSLTLSVSPSAFTAPASAPAALAPSAVPSAAPAPAQPMVSPAALPSPLASPAPAVPAVVPLAASPLSVPVAAPALRAPPPAGLSTPALDADALFDGRASRGALAAADGPTPGRTGLPPRLGPARRLRGVLRAAGVGVPLAVAVGVAGRLAPHAAMLAVHGLGQAAYFLANPFAFLFTMPQIHKILARRSAEVSAGMIWVGLLAAALTTLNFAFDGKTLMMARNLAQALGFGVMLVLHRVYKRSPGRAAPSKARAWVETLAIAGALTAVLFLAGPWLMAAVQAVALMGRLLVPIQIVSGFGFTYLMFAQLSKMRREHSAGDSSPMMMWAFLGTKTIWVWSLATMLSLTAAPAWLSLPTAAAFIAACWVAGRAALTRLLAARWSFLPERVGFMGRALSHDRMGDVAAFAALSALILLLSGAGYLAFVDLLRVPAADVSRFAMYLLYTVQSLLACLATMKSLRLRSRYARAPK